MRHALAAATLGWLVMAALANGVDGLNGAWDVLATMPGARTEVAAAAVDGHVYVVGGLGPTLNHGKRVDVYDPATNAWAPGPPLPVARHHAGLVAIGPKLFLIGGYVDQTFASTADTYMLDTSLPPALQAWLPFVPLPTPRGAHATVTDGERIFVFGGVGALGLDATAYKMDVVAGALAPVWLQIANLPDSRDHLGGGFVNGIVYAVGGRDLNLATNTGRLDAYDPSTNAWTQRASMPTPRGGIAASTLNDRLIVFGGEANAGTFDEAEAYDPVANSWSSLPRMPSPRHGLGAAALNGAIYVESGGPQPGLTFSGTNERLRLV